jgi:Arc/MetJ-type ribon-helix-helix transcriptional regulator
MRASGKVSVALSAEQLRQVRHLVDAGEFASASAVMREALRVWLHRRAASAGARARRPNRTFAENHIEPFERVELMFDAGDAKA